MSDGIVDQINTNPEATLRELRNKTADVKFHPEIGSYISFRCVRSGYCCRAKLCDIGAWNEDRSQCKYLNELSADNEEAQRSAHVLYQCTHPHGSNQDDARQIGQGCNSPMNPDRQTIVASFK